MLVVVIRQIVITDECAEQEMVVGVQKNVCHEMENKGRCANARTRTNKCCSGRPIPIFASSLSYDLTRIFYVNNVPRVV